jgi:hypothetical protein
VPRLFSPSPGASGLHRQPRIRGGLRRQSPVSCLWRRQGGHRGTDPNAGPAMGARRHPCQRHRSGLDSHRHEHYNPAGPEGSHSDRRDLGRWGLPHEIAGAAVYFASSASSYATGGCVVIDGGSMA